MCRSGCAGGPADPGGVGSCRGACALVDVGCAAGRARRARGARRNARGAGGACARRSVRGAVLARTGRRWAERAASRAVAASAVGAVDRERGGGARATDDPPAAVASRHRPGSASGSPQRRASRPRLDANAQEYGHRNRAPATRAAPACAHARAAHQHTSSEAKSGPALRRRLVYTTAARAEPRPAADPISSKGRAAGAAGRRRRDRNGPADRQLDRGGRADRLKARHALSPSRA